MCDLCCHVCFVLQGRDTTYALINALELHEPCNPRLQADMIMPISRLVSRAHHAATVQYCSLLHRHWRMGYM